MHVEFRWPWSMWQSFTTDFSHRERIRTVLETRHEAMLAEVDEQLYVLLGEYRAQADVLNRRLAAITLDANKRVVEALGVYPELVKAGRRRLVFEAPRLTELPSLGDRRRELIGDVSSRMRRAHALLHQFWKNDVIRQRFRTMTPEAVADELLRRVLPSVPRKEAL